MNLDRVIRVFPRRTKATPIDDYAFVGDPPLWWPEADEVHVSVTFTWDLPEGRRLVDSWATTTGLPTKIGGPATGMRGEEFVPGVYLRQGYVITSRGCPNRCWFCRVWRLDGTTRELPVTDGWNVADDNLLACSEEHIRAVFAMLKRQSRQPRFTGGLEAARLEPWHAELLREVPPLGVYFAYDDAKDLEPLIRANAILDEAGVPHSVRYAYVLVGYPGDTLEAAQDRLMAVVDLQMRPYAMFYRSPRAGTDIDSSWAHFKAIWTAHPRVPALVKGTKIMGADRVRQQSYYQDLSLLDPAR